VSWAHFGAPSGSLGLPGVSFGLILVLSVTLWGSLGLFTAVWSSLGRPGALWSGLGLWGLKQISFYNGKLMFFVISHRVASNRIEIRRIELHRIEFNCRFGAPCPSITRRRHAINIDTRLLNRRDRPRRPAYKRSQHGQMLIDKYRLSHIQA